MSDDINPYSRKRPGQYSNSPQHSPQYAESQNPGSSPPGSQPSPSPQPRKSHAWIWTVALIGMLVVGPVVCCGGLAIFGIFKGVAAIKAPVDAAVVALNEDPAVAAKLGLPIVDGNAFSVNDFTNNNGHGGATVEFEALGKNESAKVSGRMKLTAGAWSPESLSIQCTDSTELKIP